MSGTGNAAAVRIRSAVAADIDAFYEISLRTGDRGGDASALYGDRRMVGHIYSAPYLRLRPDFCFVAEDEIGVAGFAVGAPDTRAFEDALEREWWPDLRRTYSDPSDVAPADRTPDQRRAHTIHHPAAVPSEVWTPFPAHLHMNLFPRLQGRGVGPRLLDRWLSAARSAGVSALHVGSNGENPGAIRFWERMGFTRLDVAVGGRTVWLGRSL
ncbi:MAG: GNAT family N-acetyltransferase [Thalassobaculaceae bacterium]